MRLLLNTSLFFGLVASPLQVYAGNNLSQRADVSVKSGSDRSTLTTEFWAPLAQKNDRVIYADVRLMGDDDSNREGNLGIGYRQIYKPTHSVLGVHGWIDRRKTRNNNTFHQTTIGVESLGDKVDLRANGYIALEGAKTKLTPNLGSSTPYLAGSGIFYDTNGSVTETPQHGFDVEAGYRLPIFEKHADAIRLFGGGYHFFRGDTENVTGFRIRTEAQINKLVSIGARFQHDGPRGSQGFLEATLRFPFSAKKMYQTDKLRSRLDESPERDIDIVTGAKVESGLMKPVENTSTGQAQRVIYVDNSNANSGDGSKENPYNNLKTAEANLQAHDILYINRGDGSTTNMDQGLAITLSDITVIGSGSNFVFDNGKFATNNSKNYNGFLLQAATQAPVITNTQTNGDGISIGADNAMISGITISGAQYRGIYAVAQNGLIFNSVTVTNVTVINSIHEGIYINSSGAGSKIGNINISTVTSNNNGQNGVYSQADLGGRIENIAYDNIYASGNVLDGVRVHARDTDGYIGKAVITNINSSNNSRHGVAVYSQTRGTINEVSVSNVVSANNALYGFHISAQGGTTAYMTISNALTTNNQRGINVATQTTSQTGLLGYLGIFNTAATGNNGVGVFVRANGGSVNTVEMEGVMANNNIGVGINLQADTTDPAGITFAKLTNVTANNNTSHGIQIKATNNTNRIDNVVISNSNAIGNGGNGIFIDDDTPLAFNVDLGGGNLGSAGNNRIFGNTGTDLFVDVDGQQLKAQHNWWGDASGLQPGRVTLNSGTVDSSFYLTTDPRP